MQDSPLRRFHVWCLIVLMLAVSACSGIKLAYNNADTLLYWWVDAYLDLDSDQKDDVKADINKLFKWHRSTQLKDYVQILQTGQRQLAGNVTQADLLSDYNEVKKRTEMVLMQAVPDLTELARTIKPEQLAQMEKKFNKNNETYRKKFVDVDLDERKKLRYKKAMEQFELWFGDFSNEQEATLRRASDARPQDNQIFLEERIRRQQIILSALRKIDQDNLNQEATSNIIKGVIRDVFARLESSERKAFFDAYRDSTIQMTLTAIKIATPEQKAHAQKRMQGWIDDFNALAAAK